jgi:branched-chain amino acid transport system ATP-binding protein
MSLLSLDRVTAFYGPVQALFGVTLDVGEGEVVALMGRNGMGKTTTIRTICRMMPNAGGAIRFAGDDLAREPSHRAAQKGSGWCRRGGGAFRISRSPRT